MVATGYGVKAISSVEFDTAIANYARTSIITDAEAFAFQMVGHTFYVLRFPNANATWLYDLTMGVWTELGTWNNARGDYDVWHPRFHLSAFGKHITGEVSTGTVSLMDVTFNTEANGDVIRRLRRGPVLVNGMNRMNIAEFGLLLEPGVGLQSGQGDDPLVMAFLGEWWQDVGSGRFITPTRRAIRYPGLLEPARVAVYVGAGSDVYRPCAVAGHRCEYSTVIRAKG